METINKECPEFPKLADPKAKITKRTLNAYRHGLTGQVVLFTPDDEVAYKKHCAGVHESLAPQGYMESDIVQTIADDRWRLKRGTSIEGSIFACGIGIGPDEVITNHEQVSVCVAQGKTWLKNDKQLLNITLYEQRIQRRIERNFVILRELQAERKAAREQLVETMEALMQHAEDNEGVFDLERDFPKEFLPKQFAFSVEEIARRADWRRGYTRQTIRRLAA